MSSMRPIEKRTLARLARVSDARQLKALLCEAASKGWCEVVRELLARGVPVESRQNGQTALSLASQLGRDHVDVVQLLIAAGASVKTPGTMETCGVASLPYLLAAGGNVDGHPKEKNPLIMAITHRTEQDKALALISAGADVNVIDHDGMTPLMHAVLNGRDKVCDALLASGADPLAVDRTGRTPLRHGLETLCDGNAATQTDKRLIRRIVQVLSQNLPGQPEDIVLADIVLGNETSLLEKLQRGLDANMSILGSIGLRGVSRETMETLSRGRVTPVLPDHATADSIAQGSPLIMWAVSAGQPRCVAALLAHNADPERLNADGVSAFTMSNSPGVDAKIRRLVRDAMKCK